MMPFRDKIEKNLPRVEELALDLIAPSHGPAIGDPAAMLDAYRRWVSDRVANRVAIPYISMHESTRLMVDHLIEALTDHQIQVERLDLENLDAGKLALAMVDAATIVFGTPTVLMSAHPNVMYAVHLASLLKPKARHIGIIGSFGWGGRVVDQIHTALAGPTGAELLEPILTRGTPDAQTRAALETLAATIAERHASLPLDG
jgi:flavorubredoxin